MKHFFLVVISLYVTFNALAQKNKNALFFSRTINEKNAFNYLSVIASDKMEGRKTGTRGARMAAAYIRDQFKSFGLDGPVNGNYFQPIQIRASITPKDSALKLLQAENVLGFLPGSDPKLKDEVLVISAHYDHLGIDSTKTGDQIYNGADDDGSGTTALLMLAETFSMAKKAGHGPKRSILFASMVGEEEGLLGSSWYSEHPVYPLSNTITDLNIDMIGRNDEAHQQDHNYVYIIGSNMLSSDLDSIVKQTNKTYLNMTLDEKYNSRNSPERFYYRSDHYNFAKHGIPVVFYFNGTHVDYHQVSDEISKIDFQALAKRAQLVYFTAWELANGQKRPVVDKPIVTE